jgi:hypothetical protein
MSPIGALALRHGAQQATDTFCHTLRTVGRDVVVQQFSVGWTVRGSIPGDEEILCTGTDRL